MWNFVFVVFLLIKNAFIVRCELVGSMYPINRYTESEIDIMTDIYYHYCTSSERCNGNYTPSVGIKIQNTTICCHPCSCEASTCQTDFLKENCCPELLNEMTATPSENTNCVHPQLKPWNPTVSTTFEAFLMKSKCSVSQREYLGTEFADKCDFSYRYTDLDTRVPVTVKGLSDTYLNLYCALCDGQPLTSVVLWTPMVYCNKGTFQIYSVKNIVEQLLQSEQCTLRFFHPEKDTLQLPSCGNLISECNITGRWNVYNPIAEKGCAAFFSPFQHTYRNIFCYLCNSDGSLSDMPSCIYRLLSSYSYSVVLKYPIDDNPANDTSVYSCEQRGVFDPFQDMCLSVSCLLQKVYVGEERCENILEKIGGENFKVFLKFTPEKMLPSRFSVLDNFIPKVNAYVTNIIKEASLNDYVDNIWTSYRKEFDTIVYFLGFFSIHLPISVSPSEMVNITGIDNLLNYHGRNISLEYGSVENFSFFVEFDTVDSILEADLQSFVGSEDTPLTNDDFETLLPVHKCPVVVLDSSFYDLRNGSLQSVSNGRIAIQINRNEYILGKNESNFVICLDSYQSLVRKFYENQNTSANGNSQTITIVLLLLSLFLQV